MDPDLLALKNYLIIETAANADLLHKRLAEILALLPRASKIALLDLYKTKITLELERKRDTLSQELKDVEDKLGTLNGS